MWRERNQESFEFGCPLPKIVLRTWGLANNNSIFLFHCFWAKLTRNIVHGHWQAYDNAQHQMPSYSFSFSFFLFLSLYLFFIIIIIFKQLLLNSNFISKHLTFCDISAYASFSNLKDIPERNTRIFLYINILMEFPFF